MNLLSNPEARQGGACLDSAGDQMGIRKQVEGSHAGEEVKGFVEEVEL